MNAGKFRMNRISGWIPALFVLIACNTATDHQLDPGLPTGPYVVVLGIAQDAGYPQAGCHKECNVRVKKDPALRRNVSCLAIVDPETGRRWMFDATPDFTRQLEMLENETDVSARPLDGIFLTHAHIGHYTGLMYLGRESMNTSAAVATVAEPTMMTAATMNC